MKKFISTAIILCITSTLIFPSVASHASETTTVSKSAITQAYSYNFVSLKPTTSISDPFKTPLKQVSNTIYQASIVGKDTTCREEGFSTVLVKNTQTNSYSEFKFQTNNPDDQYTALKVPCGIKDTLFDLQLVLIYSFS